MAPKQLAVVATAQPQKPKARYRVRGKSADDPGLDDDPDYFTIGAASAVTMNDNIVLSPAQVDHVKRRKVQHTPKWKAARRIPHADLREPQEWIIKEPHCSNKPTCLECHRPIESGEVGIARKSDEKAGGRWTHCHCLPGGLRIDDRLEMVGTDSVLARTYIDEHKRAQADQTTVPDASAPGLAAGAAACASTMTQPTPYFRVLAADTQQKQQRTLAEQGLAEVPRTIPQTRLRRSKPLSLAWADGRSSRKGGFPGLPHLDSQAWQSTPAGSLPAPSPATPTEDAMEVSAGVSADTIAAPLAGTATAASPTANGAPGASGGSVDPFSGARSSLTQTP